MLQILFRRILEPIATELLGKKWLGRPKKGSFVTYCTSLTQLQLNLSASSDSEMNGCFWFGGKIVLTRSIELSMDNKSVRLCLTGNVLCIAILFLKHFVVNPGSLAESSSFSGTFSYTHSHLETAQWSRSLTCWLLCSLSSSGLRALLKGTWMLVMKDVPALLSHFPHRHLSCWSVDRTWKTLTFGPPPPLHKFMTLYWL